MASFPLYSSNELLYSLDSLIFTKDISWPSFEGPIHEAYHHSYQLLNHSQRRVGKYPHSNSPGEGVRGVNLPPDWDVPEAKLEGDGPVCGFTVCT